MKFDIRKPISKKLSRLILCGLLATAFLCNQPAFALPDYIFFSINGDTTLSEITQGDEFFWGSNCDFGATINWEIWYDANSNSTIDPSIDFLLTSENITDGNLLSEEIPIPDGWVMVSPFNLGLEPGSYILKATDIVTYTSLQKTATIIAMPSPPNQLTGQITIPGIAAPNSLLANRIIIAESENGDEAIFGAVTNNMGQYAMNIGASGTGVEFYMQTSNIQNFVTPSYISAIASGVVANNDFAYLPAVDSVWGFVRDNLGAVIQFETEVSGQSDFSEKNVTTESGRFVIYFSSSDKGDWNIESSSNSSPVYLSQFRFYFSHDTVGSFEHDIVLTKTDAEIFVRITENGSLPVNNYRVDASSELLSSWAKSVSGTGSNNISPISVSSLDNSGWQVTLNQYDYDMPIPAGLILPVDYVSNVSPGDTVSFNLIDGNSVSGTITQDPGDGPIDWSDVWVGSWPYGARVGDGGEYTYYCDTGSFIMGVYADGYISNPALRIIEISGDTTGGLGFMINETHCHVSGTLINVALPLDGPLYYITAQTGTNMFDGYSISAQVDVATGTYSLYLSDGDWTITSPCCLPDLLPADTVFVTIGELPDTTRTIDFVYSVVPSYVCGDANGDGTCNLGDARHLINYIFYDGADPDPIESGDANGDGSANLGDAQHIINYIFYDGADPVCL